MDQAFTEGIDAMTIDVETLEVVGDVAYGTGTFTQQIGEQTIEGRYLAVFHRQADGSWKIVRNASVLPMEGMATPAEGDTAGEM